MPCTEPKCLSCARVSQSVCDVCKGNFRDPSNNCVCLDGYFDAFILADNTTWDCLPCTNPKCFDCNLTGPSDCQVCKSSSRLLNQGCACPAQGFYDNFNTSNISDALTWSCVPCDSSACLVCSSTSQSYCDQCKGANRDPSANCICLSGYYHDQVFDAQNSSTWDCLQCAGDCLQCVSATVCTLCQGQQSGPAARLPPNTCICPPHYYSLSPSNFDCQGKTPFLSPVFVRHE